MNLWGDTIQPITHVKWNYFAFLFLLTSIFAGLILGLD